jgi:alkanesulfonate monooxygenase SsuD/methylene tetrahydromethanopterin reductase-like flavin-dependent oxidoreductase (luciferase family)
MHHDVVTPNWGDYGDPRLLAELAREAEAAGREGFFIWDHISVRTLDELNGSVLAAAGLNRATEDWHASPVSLSAAKGLAVRFFVAFSNANGRRSGCEVRCEVGRDPPDTAPKSQQEINH